MIRTTIALCLTSVLCALTVLTARTGNSLNEDPYAPAYVKADTIPLKDRTGDFVSDPPTNPFDLKDPGTIEKTVEYDPETGRYIVTERIGEFNFRPPTYLTFDEYLEYRKKQEENKYFRQLAGIEGEEGGSSLDPLAKMDIESSLVDRLFGGTTVDIRPQGNIDLTFGGDFQRVDNPILTERQRTTGGFDFDMNIQMNVTGKIGEKLNLTTNYNTNATFDFDNQIKLNYNSDLFSEDEILKKIEAGNVSLPLRGTLIQGAQSLFGLKTELQFGRLYLTAIASQQQSQQENIQIEGGAQLQEFEVKADEYDENRHFFLTHYNRETFEFALGNMPQIRSLFKIENIEVWITNDRNEVDNVRDIVAFADLGESERLTTESVNPNPNGPTDFRGNPLPDNSANDLYGRLLNNPGVREIDQAVSVLQSGQFQMQQSTDFEKISARKLRPSEYNIHPQLGYISLNVNVQPDQVVGVAFQYSYNGKNYKVGELSINQESTEPDSSLNVLFVKMLKSTTQRTTDPTWDLMMKNIYSIGAFRVDRNDFQLNVFYEDPGQGDKRFLPETVLSGQPLLRVFNLDQLNVQGDPQPDGVFDFIPGLTINLNNGRIMFPVLEPFGESLAEQIEDPALEEKYVYSELYDSTVFLAREFAEKNRYVIRGSYKSSVTSEISLGAFNIPPGSVRVTAGGQLLREGVDYEIDYNIGRVRILNDAILNSGVPVNVSFEDNTLFGFQTKSMFGLRADYRIDENFNIGGTMLKLFERPFTQKVNIGDDPINNTIYGLDMNLSRDAPWLTKAVDAIPGLSTKAPSNITVSAEGAVLKPGHSRAINQTRDDQGGVVMIDDFEGSASSFDLRQPVLNWYLASVPQNNDPRNGIVFEESQLVNDRRSNANRAKLSWYRIDQSARSASDQDNPYTSQVPQEEVFPNVQIPPSQLPNIQTLDLTYCPEDRGPYNFDTPNGFPGFTSGVRIEGQDIKLRDPETRWAGIMRALNTNDFQTANIEFLEFWVLSPFLNPDDPMAPADNIDQKQGTLYINLGNISEDIMRDSRKFFENGLPGPINPNRRVDTTNLSVVPIGQQITQAFDNDELTRELQDVGLDGMDDDAERREYADYIQALAAANPIAAEAIAQDPSGDNFRYYRDDIYTSQDGILTRYQDFNNPQGNSQSNTGSNQLSSATNIPDAEDLNRDNTLNETEAYFQYAIPLFYNPTNPREIDQNRTPYITDRVVSPDGERVWYRFRVPLNGPNKKAVGGIRDFRSIRFMRMFMTGFQDKTTLRFARLELVRNQWRRYSQELSEETNIPCDATTTFDVDALNIEENSNRQPFNYVLPEGIQREQSLGVFNNLQNEQSLLMSIAGLCEGEEKAVFRNIEMDFRVYERLKMFVHAEALEGIDLDDGDVTVFVRLGSDFKSNYYEYEIPLTLSSEERLPMDSRTRDYKLEVWRPDNNVDIDLSNLKDAKLRRNDEGVPLGEVYQEIQAENEFGKQHTIRIKGNPNLGQVKIAMIGVRNPVGGESSPLNTEVWLNELRLTGLDERGGAAAVARVDMQLADFGSVTLAGNISSIGFGALDQKVQERQRERITGYDLAANFQLGQFFPENWGIRFPFYGQLSNTTETPEFDPFDEDVRLTEKISRADNPQERDSIRDVTQESTTIKSFNFTNVRKERTGNASKPKPWDVENFSVSYGYTEQERKDPLLEFDRQERHTGGLDYSFSRQVNYVEPFKGINSKFLELLSQFNFNPLPNTFNFSTQLDREINQTRYRFTGLEDKFNTFFNKQFRWDRNYTMQWDLTRSLNISFNATNQAVIDEPNEFDIIDSIGGDITLEEAIQVRRDSVWENLKDFGRTKNYQHSFTVNYEAPLRYIPGLDFISLSGRYTGNYGWTAAALNTDSLGNVIQNGQDYQINADLNFETLYNKIPYLAKINRGSQPSASQRRGRAPRNNNNQGEDEKEEREITTFEKVLIRPLMSLRNARFNYSEVWQTVVPGFLPQTNILGMNPGFEAPGWDFVAGYQPQIKSLPESQYGTESDWLAQAADEGWISGSIFQNREVSQQFTQRYDGRITVEPFRDFRIDIEARREFTENHSQFFKDTLGNGEFVHVIPKNFGSLTVTYSALNTLFQDSRDEIVELFQRFEANRSIISQRIGSGTHSDSLLARQGFTEGYGRTQQDVLIPAFIAAYSGEDPNDVNLNVFNTMPNLNWRLTYNGLSRVPLFAELFQNFSLSHAYQSTLTINRFGTGLDFLRTRNSGGFNELNGNFYPRLEVPELVIQEGFSPLIGVDATLTNGMSFQVNYSKNRTLAMSFISNQLSESQSKQIEIGFGYLIRGLNIPFLTGNRNARSDAPPPPTGNNRGGARGGLQGQDLDINFTLSLRDDVTFNHLLDQGVVEPTRGNYQLSISPSAEYQLSQRLSLRLFFDYTRNEPKTSAGFPRTDSRGGIVVRFALN